MTAEITDRIETLWRERVHIQHMYRGMGSAVRSGGSRGRSPSRSCALIIFQGCAATPIALSQYVDSR